MQFAKNKSWENSECAPRVDRQRRWCHDGGENALQGKKISRDGKHFYSAIPSTLPSSFFM